MTRRHKKLAARIKRAEQLCNAGASSEGAWYWSGYLDSITTILAIRLAIALNWSPETAAAAVVDA